MAKYPLSVLDGTASEALAQILALHVLPGARIFDPTCGECILWRNIPADLYDVEFSDIAEPYNQDLYLLPTTQPDYLAAFDALIYDPPYMMGIPKSNDPRASVYGGYSGTQEALKRFMQATDKPLSLFLKKGGKILVKCSDQYYVPEKRLYLWHFDWVQALRQRYDIVDFYIYRYHRMSPTAFQVKNRNSNVIVHTYWIVGALRE